MNRSKELHVNPVTRPSRRDILRCGAMSAIGFGIANGLASLVVNAASSSQSNQGNRVKSCILLWMDGGPSHLETFDPKPESPVEVRGPFKAIETNVPGIRICEHLPRTAKICDKLAIIRSMTSPLGEHGLANHYLLSGYMPTTGIVHPSYGSVVSHLRLEHSSLPSHVAIPGWRTNTAGFLGSACEPFNIVGDPSRLDFRVRDLVPTGRMNMDRVLRRQEYLKALETNKPAFEGASQSRESSFDHAFRLVTSSEGKHAFDLSSESAEVRASYGERTFGQSCLLARRLVERGVNFVSVQNAGWDTHNDLTRYLRDGFVGAKKGVGLLPVFDQAFGALIEELSQTGLLDQTLVIAMGEFGRTPKLNVGGGRDHWPRVFSVVMAGGGIRGGQIIGSSDRFGESPKENPVTPNDLAQNIYKILGIDPELRLDTGDGRAMAINQGGAAIKALL